MNTKSITPVIIMLFGAMIIGCSITRNTGTNAPDHRTDQPDRAVAVTTKSDEEKDREPVDRFVVAKEKTVMRGKRAAAPGLSPPTPATVSGMVRDQKGEGSQVVRHNTEAYDRIYENEFRDVKREPLSTFSVDVDTAAYSNLRRFLNNGQLPPKDAIRIEELVNYFTYDYKAPTGEDPFAVETEISVAPWNQEHRLLHIGIVGKKIAPDKIPPRNLVFLLDVSGSMFAQNKLPLLQRSLKLLVNQLGERDKVAIVVYAGASGLVLPATRGDQKPMIREAIDRLRAGGSTNGGEGIKLAYDIASKNFIRGGINRVILATDGDFNVGVTNQGDLIRLIEKRRRSGVFLTVLGFGMGNYKDSTMEKLADKGNGNYAYIDNFAEARKVLVNEAGSTLITIAKDVKLQLEFNPKYVAAYRLIGYENRVLKNEDFNDDKKDAGEIGAGHTVTALYEIVPTGTPINSGSVDPLKYQGTGKLTRAASGGEMLTLKIRYKQPTGDKSKLLVFPVQNRVREVGECSDNFRFSAAVAAFGMVLRESQHKGKADFKMVRGLAEKARGADRHGYRSEFIRLIHLAEGLRRGS